MTRQCPPRHHFKWVKSDLIHSKFLNCDELQTSVKNGLTAVDSVRYINDTYLSYLLSALVKHYQHYLHVTKYERPIWTARHVLNNRLLPNNIASTWTHVISCQKWPFEATCMSWYEINVNCKARHFVKTYSHYCI